VHDIEHPAVAQRLRSLAPLLLALVLVVGGCGGAKKHGTATPSKGSSRAAAAAGFGSDWRTDFKHTLVPLSEFQSGGPGKDGIPALTRPRFASVDETRYLKPQEPVIALDVHGDVRAYPLQILVWHEIVDDDVGGVPVAVTFCPLCNTALVFERRVRGRTLVFGTTGNLRNSDLVMYDRQTESWWQQFGGRALVGEYAGVQLRQLPARIVSWAQFRQEHARGRVLTRDTGYSRPYGQNPYAGYDDASSPPFFPTAHSGDNRLEPKERVVFVRSGGESVAVPFSTLRRRPRLVVTVGGRRLEIRYRSGVASALDRSSVAGGRDVGAAEVLENGRPVPFEEPFWFAVAAFDPRVRIVR
jgi:hypothetical protein